MNTIFLILAALGILTYILIIAYAAKTRADQNIAKWHYDCMKESYEEGRRFERQLTEQNNQFCDATKKEGK
jgi:endo-beta-N-acetylglucosaminidase D